MATISNTPRPGYVWDATDNVWYPIGVGGHGHSDYITQATAVNPTIIDAKGDIITATAADTPARLAVGNNGETLVADSAATTGLRYQSNFAAGKNAIINGAFNVWQRGTSISLSNGVETYVADRYIAVTNFASGTATYSQQTFTPGTAPVSGYESQYFGRLNCSSAVTLWALRQRIEDVRTFAGQTITFSFWIKASAANASTTIEILQNFGSGGSGSASVTATGPSVTTSWQRFSVTVANPSISGKTIGTGSYLQATVYSNSGLTASMTIDTWGWQVEASNTATAFQTATGTLQGELAACQRYYYLAASGTDNDPMFGGFLYATNYIMAVCPFPTTMRVPPSLSFTTGTSYYNAYIAGSSVLFSGANFAINESGTNAAWIFESSSGIGGGGGDGIIIKTNNASARFAFSAEL
jgi:hypothetical protein